MSGLRKLERDKLQAELATVGRMLSQFSEEDVVMRIGLEDRQAELQEAVAQLAVGQPDRSASTALYFGGKPVIGARGVESEFGSKAVTMFQDLVAKQFAHEAGGLGQRGIVPNKGAARLHITNVVRGSFGFMLEEIDDQGLLLDTALKDSVDHVSDLFAAFGEDDEERFEAAVAEVDERVLATTKDFFALMRQSGATFRMVTGDRDRSMSAGAIERAERRATLTSVLDTEESIAGVFSVALPEGHQLEFRTLGERGLIRGRVARSFSAAAIIELNREWMEKAAIGHFKVRKVLKDGALVRESFTLTGIAPSDA